VRLTQAFINILKKEATLMQIFLGFFDFYEKRSGSDASFFGIF
jgi:hypothetical protein